MKIFKNIIIGYVFYASPLALIGFLVIGITEYKMSPIHPFTDMLLMGHAVFWTLISFLLTISLFFSKTNREFILKKLSGMKERDEREVLIVGKALKASYLTTMTILFFLLFISLFDIRAHTKSADNDEPYQPPELIYIHIGFEFIDSNAIITQKEGYDEYFEINDLPISSSTLIIILLLWQVASYRYVSRRSLKIPDCQD